MKEAILFLFLGAAAAVAILAAVWTIVLKQVLNRLKLNHPSTFDQLGRPRFGSDIAAHKTPQLMKFIIRRNDRQLNDEIMSRDCGILFWLVWISLPVFAFMIAMMIWLELSFGLR